MESQLPPSIETPPPMNATFENVGTSISNTVSDAAKSFSDPNQVATTSTSFLDSNGIIAKIVFLILVIIVFVILFFIAVIILCS
jgi:type IV secretory pathway VirB6-like protein